MYHGALEARRVLSNVQVPALARYHPKGEIIQHGNVAPAEGDGFNIPLPHDGPDVGFLALQDRRGSRNFLGHPAEFQLDVKPRGGINLK